jgi:hypothetical protein
MTTLQNHIHDKLEKLNLDNVQLAIFIANTMEKVAVEAVGDDKMDFEEIVDEELLKHEL